MVFQLTRSVWSVTVSLYSLIYVAVYFNSHAPCGAWLSDNWSNCSSFKNFNSHAPCGAWPPAGLLRQRSGLISTHTLRVERDGIMAVLYDACRISTHTLRVERDTIEIIYRIMHMVFQLTRSVWSVTLLFYDLSVIHILISTHTLRVERDLNRQKNPLCLTHFNSHAPCGAWLKCTLDVNIGHQFQLTRSVWSVTSINDTIRMSESDHLRMSY